MDPTSFYENVFASPGLRAELLFAGTRCSQETQLRGYPAAALHFVRAGRAQVLAPGAAPVPIDEPTLVFFPQAGPHWIRAVDARGTDLVCALATFDAAFGRALGLALPPVVVVPLARLPALEGVLGALFVEAASPEPGSRQMAARLCEVVLGHLVRHAMRGGTCAQGVLAAAGDRRIVAALQAIHTHYERELDLEGLARAAGMSRTRFAERFRAVVGTSPHSYLVRHRIAMAQQLLASRVPVKAVAGRVGFATVPAFVRRFKEIVGQSPAAWAK